MDFHAEDHPQLAALRQLLAAANRRYLEFLSTIEAPAMGATNSTSCREQCTMRVAPTRFQLLRLRQRCSVPLHRPRKIQHLRSAEQDHAPLPLGKNSGQVSRLLNHPRLHGLIRKVAHGYKYYLTQFGKQVIVTGLKLRELVIIPQLAYSQVG